MAALNARLDVRLPKRLKKLIEEAAELTGQTISDFVVSTMSEAARRVVQREQLTILGDRDRDAFLALLDEGADPNPALRRAAKWYKKHVEVAD